MSELPPGWAKARLCDICQIVQGQSPPSSTYNDEGRGLPFFQGKADFGASNPIARVWCDQPKKAAAAGDILISIRAPVGPTNIAGQECAIGRGLASIRPLSQIDPAFVLYALQFGERELQSVATGSTFAAISGAQLRELVVSVPPLAEQRRIVAEIEKQFTRLDQATHLLKSALTKLSRAQRSVFASIVTAMTPSCGNWIRDLSCLDGRTKTEHRKALPDETIPLFNPREWNIVSLDQVTTRITSGSRDWSPYYGRGTGTFVLAQNVRPRKLDLSIRQSVDPPATDASRERSAVKLGDLLVTIVGANTGDVCAVNEDLDEHYVCQSVALMRPLTLELTNYLTFYLSDDHFGRRIWKRYTYGAGRPHLGFEQLKKTPVLLPPSNLVKQLTSEMESIETVIEATQKTVLESLAHAARLRQAILAKAFSGQLVPQDPNDEPASVLLERIGAERERRATVPSKARRTGSRTSQPALQLK